MASMLQIDRADKRNERASFSRTSSGGNKDGAGIMSKLAQTSKRLGFGEGFGVLSMATLKPSFPSFITETYGDLENEVQMLGFLSLQRRATRMWRLHVGLLTKTGFHIFFVSPEGLVGDKVTTTELKNVTEVRLGVQTSRTNVFMTHSEPNMKVEAPLEDLAISSDDLNAEDFEKNCFEILTIDGKIKRFCTPTRELMNTWMNKLRPTVQEAKQKVAAHSNASLGASSSFNQILDLSSQVSIELVTICNKIDEYDVRDDLLVKAHFAWDSHVKMCVRQNNFIRVWLSNTQIISMKIGPNQSVSVIKYCHLEDGKLIETNSSDVNENLEYKLECLTRNKKPDKEEGESIGSYFDNLYLLIFGLGLSAVLTSIALPGLQFDKSTIVFTLSNIVFAAVTTLVGYRHAHSNVKVDAKKFDALTRSVGERGSVSNLDRLEYEKIRKENHLKQQSETTPHEYDFHLKRFLRLPPKKTDEEDNKKKKLNVPTKDLDERKVNLVRNFSEEFKVGDMTAVRFLNARQFNYNISSELFIENIKIRKELCPYDVDKLIPILQMGMFHFSGIAKDGTAIVVFDVNRFIAKRADAMSINQLIIMVTDLVCALTPTEALTIIADCKDFSIMKNVDLSQASEIIRVVNVCIPEMMARVLVVNPPYAIKGVWNFIKGLLDERTVDKIRFLNKAEFDILLDFIDSEHLDPKYGGSCTLEYNTEIASQSTEENIKLGVIKSLNAGVTLDQYVTDKFKELKANPSADLKSLEAHLTHDNPSTPATEDDSNPHDSLPASSGASESNYARKSTGNDHSKKRTSKISPHAKKKNRLSTVSLESEDEQSDGQVFCFSEECDLPLDERFSESDSHDRRKKGGMNIRQKFKDLEEKVRTNKN